MMACAPCLALCSRLRAVCARRCVCGPTLCALGAVSAARAILLLFVLRCVFARVDGCALYSVFFLHHYSETRMLYFFALPIWLVAVTAQVTMNPADSAALNQTLTELGCWPDTEFQLRRWCFLQRQWFGDVLVRPTRAFTLSLCSCSCADNSTCEINRNLNSNQLKGTISTFIGQLTALTQL